ncbi:MAG: hypothetical protein DRP54_01140 [Spirochaetes bacterium]|nr:MAG: hypothetical protein DRP54_01140 [Spirochaetota bacterium]
MVISKTPIKIGFHFLNKQSHRARALRLALKWKIKDIYLLEGLERKHRGYRNYAVIGDGKIIGLLHVRAGMFTHLFLNVPFTEYLGLRLKGFLSRNYPDNQFIFSHENIIRQIIENSIFRIKRVKEFYFMEVDRNSLKKYPGIQHRVPTVSSAQDLLPLFIKYESEELNVNHTYSERTGLLLAVRRKLQKEEITALYDGNKPVGIAGINASFNGICQIGYVFVLPEYRGKGYGKRLITAHAERLLSKCSKVVLFVRKENIPAYRLYLSCGFKVTETLAQIWLPGGF